MYIYSNCRTYILFSDLQYMTSTPKSHYIICRCPRLSQSNVSREYFSRVKTGVTSKQQKPFSFLPTIIYMYKYRNPDKATNINVQRFTKIKKCAFR